MDPEIGLKAKIRQKFFKGWLIQLLAVEFSLVCPFIRAVMQAVQCVEGFAIEVRQMIRDGVGAPENQKHHGQQQRIFRKILMPFEQIRL